MGNISPDAIYCCIIPVGFLGIIFAVMYVVRLLMPADAFIKKRNCPRCSGRNSGLLVDERMLGMFQKVTDSDRRGVSYGRFEKYELTYKCEACEYQWQATYVKDA